jgi:SAM-dependent methyltransferase
MLGGIDPLLGWVVRLAVSNSTDASVPARSAGSYESLTGGRGRSIFFRAERHRPKSLLGRIPPTVEVGDRKVPLYDLSTTGLAYWADDRDAVLDKGERCPVRLLLGDVVAFAADGEIVRHQPEGPRTKVALRFLGDHLVHARLKALHDGIDFERSVATGLEVYAAVPAAYRSTIEQARLFVAHWRALLDEREKRVRQGVDLPDLPSALGEVEASVESRMREEWRGIHEAANAASSEIVDGEALLASKRYTETMLTSSLLDVPLIQHCYRKPLGYPGDYQAMNRMYSGQRRGDSIFARVMDQLTIEERLAATVVVRKRFMVEQLRECVADAAKRHSDPIRIVSIGAGPAREIQDFLEATPPGPELEIVLVDQDQQALAHADEACREAARRHGERVRVVCRHLSFKQLFALPELVDEVSGADMIYTVGLFDYLGEAAGRALMNSCFGLLRAGGRLVVGNAAAAPDVRWVPEFVLDWTMIYRTETELRALARDFTDRATIGIECDDSAAWLFLVAIAGDDGEKTT